MNFFVFRVLLSRQPLQQSDGCCYVLADSQLLRRVPKNYLFVSLLCNIFLNSRTRNYHSRKTNRRQFENQTQKQKKFTVYVFEVKLLQRARFWKKCFTTCQCLKWNFYRMSLFGSTFSQRNIFWRINVTMYQSLNWKFHNISSMDFQTLLRTRFWWKLFSRKKNAWAHCTPWKLQTLLILCALEKEWFRNIFCTIFENCSVKMYTV